MADSRNRKDYKLGVQAAGVSLPNTPFKAVPMTATPVTKRDPGLGAKTIAHPFKNGKPQI